MFQSLKQWYLALSPRRRTLYSVLISIIVATIPCYCMGGWAVTQGFPWQSPPPDALATATSVLEPTPTQQPSPTLEPTPVREPTATLEPTPTQGPTATETPTALPTETETPTPTGTPPETATPEPSSTPTGTATPTAEPTGTPTVTPTVTATHTPAISGTIAPPPELVLTPSSGPAGIEMTITGRYFTPYLQYLVYWDTPDMPIGIILADDIGQIAPVVYTVPLTATAELHQVVVESDGTVVTRAPFEVTAANTN